MREQYTRWMRMAQLAGLVVAFIFALAVATPVILAAEPANALNWALYYELGRSFALLSALSNAPYAIYGYWFAAFMLSLVICYLDIRRRRFFVSAFVLAYLLAITLMIIFTEFFVNFFHGEPIGAAPPWTKLAFLIICGNFMYIGLRTRYFQLRRSRAAQRRRQDGEALSGDTTS